MALVSVTMQKNIHASFKLQYVNVHSDDGDAVEQGIKVGDDGGVYRTIIMMQLPEAYDVYSVVGASSSDTDNADGTAKTFGYVDPNVVLKDIELKIKTLDDANDGAGGLDKDNAYLIRHLKQDPNYKFLESVSLVGAGIGLPTHDSIEQDFTASSTLTKPYFGKLSADGDNNEGDIRAGIDYTTDFGYGATGVIDFCLFPKKNTEYTFSLAKFIKSKNLTWGDKVTFVLEKNTIDTTGPDYVGGTGFGIPGNTHNGFIESQDGWSTTKGVLESMTLETPSGTITLGSVKHQSMDVTLFYDDPEPARPVIELTPDDDMVSGVITLKSKPSERDIVALTTIFTTGAATTIGNAKGVVYSSSNRVINYGINGDTLKQSNNEINSGFLATADTPYNIAVYAEDNVNKVSSNMITHERMSCSGSVSPSPPTIGQTATLTVSGTLDGSAKEFSKVGVNWDGNSSASSDNLEDYDIITLDSPASSATLTHTYDKSKNAYKVNIFVVDEKGFRSDFTQAASLNVAEGTPVAKLRLSKETVMVGDQADELSVVTASAAQSFTVGSDKQLFAYIFGCTGSDITAAKPVTTYPTANDNTGFSESSKKVRLKANVAACDGTTIRVYGRISVDASGGNVVDTDSSFSHYEQKVIQLSAHPDADKDFTAGSGWVDGTNSSSEFFKSVEFVVCSVRDHPEDTRNVYYSLGDTSGNIINNQIRVVEENSDPASAGSWGGYLIANLLMTNLNINGSNNTITRGGGSGEFISNGLAIGDKIYISAPEDEENNSFFTVTDLSSTVITVAESLTTNSNDGTAIIYKVNGPTLSFTALDEMTATVDLRVADTFAAQSTSDDNNVSAAVTQDVKFKEIVVEQYLDLDTISDAGEISIQAANLSRSGGLASNMALGNSRYPTNAFRTKLGKPVLQVQLRILTQAGYRRIWSLIEGDRYIFSTIDLKKIDSPAVAYKQVRLRLENGTINKDPSMASQYVASLNFVVIGELYDLSGLTA